MTPMSAVHTKLFVGVYVKKKSVASVKVVLQFSHSQKIRSEPSWAFVVCYVLFRSAQMKKSKDACWHQ